MLTSKDRILTTHCGSLPRPAHLSDLLLRQEVGEPIDTEMLRRECADAVSRALEGQMQAGIDIVSDGEQPRVGQAGRVIDHIDRTCALTGRVVEPPPSEPSLEVDDARAISARRPA